MNRALFITSLLEATSRDNHSAPYIKWRNGVLERDGFKCTQCGAKGEDALGKGLHACHKKGKEYGGVRDECSRQGTMKVAHGVTMCRTCHGNHDYKEGTAYK